MAHVRLAGVGVTFRIFDAGQRSFTRRLWPFGGNQRDLEIDALSNVDLSVEPGSRIALLGANSSGKTTLMRVIAGLVPPQRGQVAIEGSAGAVFGMGFGVDPEASLAELAYAQGLLDGLNPSVARTKVPEILAFAEIDEHADCKAHIAPPGLLSRLGIASILCLGADIILLDEVLDHLDPRFHQKYEEAILRRVADGAILMMVERSRDLLTRFCTEALVLTDGTISARAPLATTLATWGPSLIF